MYDKHAASIEWVKLIIHGLLYIEVSKTHLADAAY